MKKRTVKVVLIAAARPNFVKVGPLYQELRDRMGVELIHTGQHYDIEMSDTFFRDLSLPSPDVNLGVGSGTHAEQTAGVMVALERHLLAHDATAVIVVGDVNSTMAAALVAAKLGIPIGHVEAGLRSRDWTMPEEINRIVTDRLSSWLFTPSEDADQNLLAEGISQTRIHRVGNIMIDSLFRELSTARRNLPKLRSDLSLPAEYGLMTLHRPSNVDDSGQLQRVLGAVVEISRDLPIVFPVHPRTARRIDGFGLDFPESIRRVSPLGYVDFLALMTSASIVLTDSGGIQEETSVLGVPCITLRETTERPITCEMGTNQVVGGDPDAIVAGARSALARSWTPADIPLWDGKTASRVADVLESDLLF